MSAGETARATLSSVSLGEETNGLQGRAPGCAGPRVQRHGRINAESDTSLTLRCSQFGGGDGHQCKSSKAAERANGRGSGKGLPVLKRCRLDDILQGKDLHCHVKMLLGHRSLRSRGLPRNHQGLLGPRAGHLEGSPAWPLSDCGPMGSSSFSGERR